MSQSDNSEKRIRVFSDHTVTSEFNAKTVTGLTIKIPADVSFKINPAIGKNVTQFNSNDAFFTAHFSDQKDLAAISRLNGDMLNRINNQDYNPLSLTVSRDDIFSNTHWDYES